MNPTPDPQYPAPVLWRGPWTEPAPILTRGSAFVFAEEASRAVASALPFTDLAQLDILGNVPDYEYLQQLEGIGVLTGERRAREIIYKHPALVEVLTA